MLRLRTTWPVIHDPSNSNRTQVHTTTYRTMTERRRLTQWRAERRNIKAKGRTSIPRQHDEEVT
ncbi:hypothetical protein PM082_015539 [Marasmius tenuissimus]|nr:hypothetical protein PM082_015539 [Marasmius tenuissimus]